MRSEQPVEDFIAFFQFLFGRLDLRFAEAETKASAEAEVPPLSFPVIENFLQVVNVCTWLGRC